MSPTRTTTLIAFALAAAAHAAPVQDVADDPGATLAARIDRYLSGMETLGFSGAIAVVHGDEVVLRAGYGFADREARVAFTPDTLLSNGSITKQFTAAAVLLLEQRGELSVDDLITAHFDDVPDDKRGITLHHLLTHTSGLPGHVGQDQDAIEADAYVDLALAAPLLSAPGATYDYSNVGYSLLGIVVERVSGRDYEEFLRDELLLPTGLVETGYRLAPWNDDPGDRLAVGYDGAERWGISHKRGWLDDGPGWHLRANGGLITTVDDMARWLSVLRGEGPLDAETVERWTTGTVDEGGGSMYAYGWAVEEDSGYGRMIAHTGSNGILTADFVWLPDIDLCFYVHGNTSTIPASRQRHAILAAAFEPDAPTPPTVRADPDADPALALARAGTYRIGDARLEVTADDARLVARPWGRGAFDLLLQPSPEQRARLDALDERTAGILAELAAGRLDAFEGHVPPGETSAEQARFLLDRIDQVGELESLSVMGTIVIAPGTWLAQHGAHTTLVRADFEHWIQTWQLVWHDDGTYRGTAFGSGPQFVLVPTGASTYTGVRREAPWDTVDVRFDDGCLVHGDERACRDG